MKKILFVISIVTLFIACKKESSNNNNTSNSTSNNNSKCDYTVFNSNFSKITKNSTYESVKLIFGNEGDNYRNDGVGSTQIKFYKWYPCANKVDYVDCWFQNGELILATKTFKNEICSNNITSNSFSSLSNGMTYEQVCVLLDSKGDNFRNDYTSTEQTNFYRYYNCSDKLKYIEVWFENNSAILITKNL